MSFDKNYPNRKDHRKQYYDSRAFDCTCRNHGACPVCLGNRTYSIVKRKQAIEDKLKEWENEIKM